MEWFSVLYVLNCRFSVYLGIAYICGNVRMNHVTTESSSHIKTRRSSSPSLHEIENCQPETLPSAYVCSLCV